MTGKLKKKNWYRLVKAPLEHAISPVKVELPKPNIGGYQTLRKYRLLSWLDKFYIYTDYVPREQGSWKYKQDNQPEVIIDYRLYPGDQYFPACRDRRYRLQGYAVCEDFYSPDYSRKPLPETKDYRRTLLWIPEVKFDEKGKPPYGSSTTANRPSFPWRRKASLGKEDLSWNSPRQARKPQ